MTPEVRLARLGKMTASKAAVVMGGLETDGLARYVKSLAFERVYGDPEEEWYESPPMKRGTILEAQALDWYVFDTDSAIDKPGCIDHPTILMVSATPDAIRTDRVIEVKSPLHTTWAEVKLKRQVPSEYRWQCRWQMFCTGLTKCDFVCYHPKSGGIIVPFSVTEDDIDQMAKRTVVVEAEIRKWVEILNK